MKKTTLTCLAAMLSFCSIAQEIDPNQAFIDSVEATFSY